MYKVFINDYSITLHSDPQKKDVIPPDGSGSIEDGTELVDMVHSYLDGTLEGDRSFYTDQLEIVWNEFRSAFHNIAAAGGVVRNLQDQLLMIFRLNRWDLPKGKIEAGEDRSVAALREVEEECGIKNLTLMDPLNDMYHVYKMHDKVVLKTTYWFQMLYEGDEELVPQLEEDISVVEWVATSQLPGKLENTYASIKWLLTEIEEYNMSR